MLSISYAYLSKGNLMKIITVVNQNFYWASHNGKRTLFLADGHKPTDIDTAARSLRAKGGYKGRPLHEIQQAIEKAPTVLYKDYKPVPALEFKALMEGNLGFIYNTYVPPVIVPNGDLLSEPPALWTKLLTGLFPDPEQRAYAEQWMAHLVRYPGEKCTVVMVLRGEKGIGKGTLIEYILRNLVGPSNYYKARNFMSEENAGLATSTLVHLEELYGARGRFLEKMKSLTGGGTAEVKALYANKENKEVFCRFIIDSNDLCPIMLEESDRRFFVPDFVDYPEGLTATEAQQQVMELRGEMESWLKDGGWQMLRNWLEQVDLSTFRPTAPPPVTPDKIEMMASASSADAEFLLGKWLSGYSAKNHIVLMRPIRDATGLNDKQIAPVLKSKGYEPANATNVPGANEKTRFWYHSSNDPKELCALDPSDYKKIM